MSHIDSGYKGWLTERDDSLKFTYFLWWLATNFFKNDSVILFVTYDSKLLQSVAN